MSKSTTISLFLVDGTANGRIKCTINSRTGIIFKIPRKDLAKCKTGKGRDALENDGVYFLLGEENGKQKVYVGQAASRKNGKGLLNRLSEHARSSDKNFWTEALVLTTSDNSFGATEISWLEHKFCNMAIKSGRCEIVNGNEPSPGNITEEKESDLEDHVEFAQLILSAIGYKFLEPQQKNSPLPVVEPVEEIFVLSRKIKRLGRPVTAQMKRTPTGYKVLVGSEISPMGDDKLSANMKKRRNAAKIVDGRLTEDEEFSSPSGAAQFVTGNNTECGPDVWKLNGVPLKKFLQDGD